MAWDNCEDGPAPDWGQCDFETAPETGFPGIGPCDVPEGAQVVPVTTLPYPYVTSEAMQPGFLLVNVRVVNLLFRENLQPGFNVSAISIQDEPLEFYTAENENLLVGFDVPVITVWTLPNQQYTAEDENLRIGFDVPDIQIPQIVFPIYYSTEESLLPGFTVADIQVFTP